MLQRIQNARHEYPRQFWLLFFGMLISTTGGSMIWPFMMIYVRDRLGSTLTDAAFLNTISAFMGLLSSLLVGPIIDRIGRKWVMVISLGVNACGFLLLSQAKVYGAFALIMGINGAFNPLYRVGADAMMADLIPPEKRIDAYSLLRMSSNVGVALGPALGGIISAISFNYIFLFGAIGLLSYGLLVTFFARETLPKDGVAQKNLTQERLGGYPDIFKDKTFMRFIGTFALVQMCAALIWVLLGDYVVRNYGVLKAQYGLIPTTNALMVVFFQYLITQLIKKREAFFVLASGALLYALANLSISFGQGYWAFWTSMVIMTIGELMLVPTSSTFVANLAPVDKRGRYMSLYTLSWGLASGIGPLWGGFLNDHLGPKTIWYGGFLVGLLSVIGFLRMARRKPTSHIK